MKKLLAAVVASAVMATISSAPAAAQTIKVGVLPYSDATASGGATIGDTLSRLTQAEIIHSTQLQGQVILINTVLRPEQLDSAKLVALGKDSGVDMIVMGTLLEAKSEEGAQSAIPHSFFGQTLTAGLHSWKATVTIQADVYSVATGQKLDSLRVSQTENDKKISGSAVTALGSMDTSTPAFQNSTLGKALQKAIADLVKHLDAEKTKLPLPSAANSK